MHFFSLDEHGSGSRVLQASSVRFLILSVMLGMGHRLRVQPCLLFAFLTLGSCSRSIFLRTFKTICGPTSSGVDLPCR